VSGDDPGSGRPPRPARPGLTAEEFEALLAWLHPGREEAGRTYEGVRRRLIRLLEWRGCDVAEELADETVNRVARRIAEGVDPEVRDHFHYFRGVAIRVLLEHWRRRERERLQLAAEWQGAGVEEPADDDEEADEKHVALSRCLERQPRDDRDLIERYYEGDDRIRCRSELAEQLGTNLNALRIRVFRIRKRVAACVKKSLAG